MSIYQSDSHQRSLSLCSSSCNLFFFFFSLIWVFDYKDKTRIYGGSRITVAANRGMLISSFLSCFVVSLGEVSIFRSLWREKIKLQMNWGTICCSAISCLQLYWTRLVIRKWFNVSSFDSDYSADTDDDRPSLSPSQGHTSFRLKLKSFFFLISCD